MTDPEGLLDSWWLTGLFVLACIVNLLLFDRHKIGPWFPVALAALVVVFFVIAAGSSSSVLTIIAMIGFVLLVAVGVIARTSQRRRHRGVDW